MCGGHGQKMLGKWKAYGEGVYTGITSLSGGMLIS